ncbi:MAG: type I glyceraldehyde-3-phosphate dehydrogenase [Candidatus Babeliales bacterium]
MTKYILFVSLLITTYALPAHDEKKGSHMNVAINGFGRIGRNFLRCVLEDSAACKKIKIVAINLGPMNLDAAAHLFKHDTLLGTWPGNVELKGDNLIIDGHEILLSTECDPCACPWKKLNIDWVVESSGRFTDHDGASGHLKAGARHVLVTAPMKGDDTSIVPGVNLHDYDAKRDSIVSLGSCTTNALMPLLKVLLEQCGMQAGYMSTIHAYTNDQVILDVGHKDLRRARAAAVNIVPTTTGAATMIAKLFPQLKDKVPCTSIRVPVPKVSLLDVSFTADKAMSVELINKALLKASQDDLQSIMGYSDEPLVSSDYNKNNNSVTIDSLMTQACGKTGRVFGWYDNEWGYSERLKDFLIYIADH